LIGNSRIVLRMKHHDLRRTNFRSMMDRVIKLSTKKLLPIPIRQPIPISKRRPNIRSITRIRSLLLLFARKNRPIHHRTISNHFLHARIERGKNSRRPAKTPPDHKEFIHRDAKSLPKRQLAKLSRKSPNHVQNIQVRRSCQKLPATLPRSPIARIKHPVSLPREKFSQRLFARNRRHPIAQDNRPLPFPRSSRSQEFSYHVVFKSCPEHGVSKAGRSESLKFLNPETLKPCLVKPVHQMCKSRPPGRAASTTIFRAPLKPRRSRANHRCLRLKRDADSSYPIRNPKFHRCTILL